MWLLSYVVKKLRGSPQYIQDENRNNDKKQRTVNFERFIILYSVFDIPYDYLYFLVLLTSSALAGTKLIAVPPPGASFRFIFVLLSTRYFSMA